jgi:HlyD family secretion protein
MTAQVTLVAAERKDAIRLPNAALRYRPKSAVGRDAQASADDDSHDAERSDSDAAKPSDRQNYVTVYVLDHNHAVAKRVHLGIGDGHFVEVLQGLKIEDKVIVGDSQTAASGSAGSRRGPRGPF